jgi:hypothetical protein
MTKKLLLHFNVLYLGVFLSLIILPSLAWSQVFEEEIEDTPPEEVVLAQESVEEEVAEEIFVNPLEQVMEESLEPEPVEQSQESLEESGLEGEVDESEVPPLSEEPEPADVQENESGDEQELVLPEEPLINEEPEVFVEEEPLVEEIIEEPFVEPIEEPIVEEPPFEDTIPALTVRRFEKPIFFDKEALHSCEAEQFRMDVSGERSLMGEIFLNKNLDIAYEVEVGSLPDGIDLRFFENNKYVYQPGSSEDALEFEIFVQDGAQKGNFTVPFIYTQKGLGDSSVVCQLNIINL